jgi:hypothetical protein
VDLAQNAGLGAVIEAAQNAADAAFVRPTQSRRPALAGGNVICGLGPID